MDDHLRAMGYREFDVAEHLNSPDRITAFVNDALADHDQAYLQHALEVAARARAMHGLDAPRPMELERDEERSAFEAVRRRLESLGMKLAVVAA